MSQTKSLSGVPLICLFMLGLVFWAMMDWYCGYKYPYFTITAASAGAIAVFFHFLKRLARLRP